MVLFSLASRYKTISGLVTPTGRKEKTGSGHQKTEKFKQGWKEGARSRLGPLFKVTHRLEFK